MPEQGMKRPKSLTWDNGDESHKISKQIHLSSTAHQPTMDYAHQQLTIAQG